MSSDCDLSKVLQPTRIISAADAGETIDWSLELMFFYQHIFNSLFTFQAVVRSGSPASVLPPGPVFFCIVLEKEGHVIVRWLKSETLFACNLRQMGQRCREICRTNCSSTSSVFYITENQHALIWKFAWPKVKPNHLGMSVVAPYNLLIIKTD